MKTRLNLLEGVPVCLTDMKLNIAPKGILLLLLSEFRNSFLSDAELADHIEKSLVHIMQHNKVRIVRRGFDGIEDFLLFEDEYIKEKK